MDYEIRIWKDPKKMPHIEPKQAAGRLEAMANKVKDTAKLLGGSTSGANPDILIDKNGGGDDVITSIDISYVTAVVDSVIPILPSINQSPNSVQGVAIGSDKPGKKKVRVIKMHIKGNLYLPLKEDGLTDAAKSMAGLAKDENKIRDTLLLSKWAQVIPEDDATLHFYRGIIVSVLTKAGDFRVITAKKVYVDSYTENYNEGEFGTFELSLIEKVDSNVDFTVEGLGYEEIPLLKSVGNKLEKAVKVVAGVGTAVAAVGAVGKTVTETVEKFTGETAVTKWIKYGMDTASTAGNIAGSTSKIMKNPKDVKTWTEETQKITKGVSDNIKNAKDKADLDELESNYLALIERDPESYQKYRHMSQAEKSAALKAAAKEEVASLEKKYSALIKANPALSEKYSQSLTGDKLKMLQEQKKNFDDMEKQYLDDIKKDPKKLEEYNKADTATQLKMLEEEKKAKEEKEKLSAQNAPSTTNSNATNNSAPSDNATPENDTKPQDTNSTPSNNATPENDTKPKDTNSTPSDNATPENDTKPKDTNSTPPNNATPENDTKPKDTNSTPSDNATPENDTKPKGTNSTPSDNATPENDTKPKDTNSTPSDNATPENDTKPQDTNSKPPANSSTGKTNLNDKINLAANKKNGGSNGKK